MRGRNGHSTVPEGFEHADNVEKIGVVHFLNTLQPLNMVVQPAGNTIIGTRNSEVTLSICDLVRAFHALFETAIKFSEDGKTVRLACEVVADSIWVIVESHGRRIASSAVAKFFDIFSIGEAITHGGDLGLGPPLACRILSLFGASVSVANRDLPGIRFTVSLKGIEPERASLRGPG